MRDDRHGPGAAARVLLVGASRPGKILAARAVAAALGADLLTVDVSRVVSTWIGETETPRLLERVQRFRGTVVLATSDPPVDPPGWLTVVEADADDPVGRVGREPTTDGS